MKIDYEKRFLKELFKLKDKKVKEEVEKFVFNELPLFNSLSDAQKIEKMSGYKEYYKVRFGNYRVGIKKENELIVIKTIKHRREIYKFFP